MTTVQTHAQSPILDAVHETARDLHRLGFIDKRKMRKFDALCLEPLPAYDSTQIRALRTQFNLSQAVLAGVLNTFSILSLKCGVPASGTIISTFLPLLQRSMSLKCSSALLKE